MFDLKKLKRFGDYWTLIKLVATILYAIILAIQVDVSLAIETLLLYIVGLLLGAAIISLIVAIIKGFVSPQK